MLPKYYCRHEFANGNCNQYFLHLTADECAAKCEANEIPAGCDQSNVECNLFSYTPTSGGTRLLAKCIRCLSLKHLHDNLFCQKLSYNKQIEKKSSLFISNTKSSLPAESKHRQNSVLK